MNKFNLSSLASITVLSLVAFGLFACGVEETQDTAGNPIDMGPPSVPSNLSAVSSTPHSIALAWNHSTDDVGVTGYIVLRDGDPVDNVAENSFIDDGLASSRSYTYAVIAFDAAGNLSSPSLPVTATTLDPGQSDTQPPTVPSNLRVTAVAATRIDLAWNGSTDNIGVAGYEVFRGTTRIATVTNTSYSDTGLTVNSTYSYMVRAFDGAGNRSGSSSPVTATTTADTSAPSVPSGLRTTGSTSSSISLAWNPSTDDVGIAGYRVYRGGVQVGSPSNPAYTDTGLSPNTSYTYTVAAYDAAGNVSAPSSGSVFSTPAAGGGWADHLPVPVQDVATGTKDGHADQGPRRIARIGNVTIALASRVNNVANRDGIYRSTDNGTTWSLVGQKDNATRGTIITGPNNMFLAFWVDTTTPGATGIYMTRWAASSTAPPVPSRIYGGYVTSVQSGGGYQQISASVDRDGNVYVVTHFAPSSGQVDRIWLLRSMDGGTSWSTPTVVHQAAGVSFILPNIAVDHSGQLVVSFAHAFGSYLGGLSSNRRVFFTRSADRGVSWTPAAIVDPSSTGTDKSNIFIIESRSNNLFIFGQSYYQGLAMAKSTDGGVTWSPFRIVSPTSDYADPSGAIGSDGTIYVTFRTDKNASGAPYSCPSTSGYCWTNAVVSSIDEGTTWTRVDSNRIEDRTGPANSMRYQTWWNYGGPLEWTWQQWMDSNTSLQPVYYDINPNVAIYDILSQ